MHNLSSVYFVKRLYLYTEDKLCIKLVFLQMNFSTLFTLILPMYAFIRRYEQGDISLIAQFFHHI